MKQAPSRVFVTGLGVVSPLGLTTDQLWTSLISGKSGVGPFSFARSGDSPIPYAGCCRDFSGDIADFGSIDSTQKRTIRKAVKLMSREIQMGVASAQLALQDALFQLGSIPSHRLGVSFGCDMIYSELFELEEAQREYWKTDLGNGPDFRNWPKTGMSKMSPLWQLKYLTNMPSSHIAIINDCQGPSNSIVLREASVGAAVGEAVEMIRSGRADLMIVGATGSRIQIIKLIQTLLQEQVSRKATDFQSASRPFDQHRDGMVIGEGAGALILESEEQVLRRGVTPYVEVLGGCSRFFRDPNRDDYGETALVNAMQHILKKCDFDLHDLGHINAHGLSATAVDRAESAAIIRVLGQLGPKRPNGPNGHNGDNGHNSERTRAIPITAAKGHFGNLGAGSGAVELIASILSLKHGQLFPTLNYESGDPDLSLPLVKSGETVVPGDSFLKLAVNSQNQASALLVRRCS